MKIVKSLDDSGILIKCETIENEAKEQKGGILCILLGSLGASLLRNLLTYKGAICACDGDICPCEKLILPHPLTNF